MIDKFQAMIIILKYLIDLDEHNVKEENKYNTRHGIAVEAFSNSQREPRLANILKGLVLLGYVEESKRKDIIYFKITEKGKADYKKTLREASNIFRSIIEKELLDEK